MSRQKPPLLIRWQANGPGKRVLYFRQGYLFDLCVDGHDLTGRISEGKKIATAQPPGRVRRVLDGLHVVGGHQGLDCRQIREELRGAAEHYFTLTLKCPEREQGIPKIAKYLCPQLVVYGLADNHDGGNRHGENAQEQQDQKLEP